MSIFAIDFDARKLIAVSNPSVSASREAGLPSDPYGLAALPEINSVAVACLETGVLILDGVTLASKRTLASSSASTTRVATTSGYLAFGSLDNLGTIGLFSSPKFDLLGRGSVHKEVITSLVFSPGSDQLVSAAGLGLLIWKVPAMEVLRELKGHRDLVRSAQYLSASVIATASYDHSIRIWDVSSGSNLKVISNNTNIVQTLATNSNRSKFACSSGDKTVKVYDCKTYDCVKSMPSATNVLCLGFADETTLIVGAVKSELTLVDAATGSELKKLAPYMQTPLSIVLM